MPGRESVLQCTQCAAYLVVAYKRGVTSSSNSASSSGGSTTTMSAWDVLTRWYTTQLVTAHASDCSFRTAAERYDAQDNDRTNSLPLDIPRRWIPYMPRQVMEFTHTRRPLPTLGAQVEQQYMMSGGDKESLQVNFPATVQSHVPPPLSTEIDSTTGTTPPRLLTDGLGQVLQQAGWCINNNNDNNQDVGNHSTGMIGTLALLTLLGWYYNHPEPTNEKANDKTKASLPLHVVACPLCRATWDMSPPQTATEEEEEEEDASGTTTPSQHDPNGTEAPGKRRRVSEAGMSTITTVRSKNALTAHRHYCPYVSGFPRALSLSTSSTSACTMTPPLWKTLVDQIFDSAEDPTTTSLMKNDTNVWVQANALFHTGLSKPPPKQGPRLSQDDRTF